MRLLLSRRPPTSDPKSPAKSENKSCESHKVRKVSKSVVYYLPYSLVLVGINNRTRNAHLMLKIIELSNVATKCCLGISHMKNRRRRRRRRRHRHIQIELDETTAMFDSKSACSLNASYSMSCIFTDLRRRQSIPSRFIIRFRMHTNDRIHLCFL